MSGSFDSTVPCTLAATPYRVLEKRSGFGRIWINKRDSETAPTCLDNAADDIDAHRQHGNVENEAEDAMGECRAPHLRSRDRDI